MLVPRVTFCNILCSSIFKQKLSTFREAHVDNAKGVDHAAGEAKNVLNHQKASETKRFAEICFDHVQGRKRMWTPVLCNFPSRIFNYPQFDPSIFRTSYSSHFPQEIALFLLISEKQTPRRTCGIVQILKGQVISLLFHGLCHVQIISAVQLL